MAEKRTKEEFYMDLKKLTKRHNREGITFTTGDFNARLQKAITETERERIGPHTFNPENDRQFRKNHS